MHSVDCLYELNLNISETSAFACLETGCQTKEAIPYCQKAILICKSRMERLTNEVKCPSGTATSSAVSEIDQGIQQSSDVPCIDDKSASEKEAEIRTLSGLAEELEKKASVLNHRLTFKKKKNSKNTYSCQLLFVAA